MDENSLQPMTAWSPEPMDVTELFPWDAQLGLYCSCLYLLLDCGSNEWIGHWRTSHFCALKNSWVAFAVWFGSECVHPPVTSSVNTSELVPLAVIHSHTIILPPSYLTNGMIDVWSRAVFSILTSSSCVWSTTLKARTVQAVLDVSWQSLMSPSCSWG